MKKEYWTCVVGPCESSKLPNGADFPMRQAIKQVVFNMTGEYPENVWSGWGCDEDEKNAILNKKE